MLTKSDLLSVHQCPRQLWLKKNQPELAAVDRAADRRLNEGILVGDLARKVLGDDFIWPPTSDDKSVASVNAMLLLADHPDKAAVEVPMFFDGIYARADAFIPEGDGYVLRETKAVSFPLKKDKVTPDKPDPVHVLDAAIQAYVMQNSGLPMQRVELNLLDNQWEYQGDGNYIPLFKQLDVTREVQELLPEIPALKLRAEQVLAGPMPQAETGKQCKAPHECPFQAFCKSIDPPRTAHPIELLPDSAGKKLAAKLKAAKGYVSILEPKPDELTGASAELYRRIQLAHRTGTAVTEPNMGAELANLPYPRYYFDFEGIDLAVPQWKGVRAYEQIPFQWSCHIERSPGVFEHTEFLDLSGNDPSLGCIEVMRKAIDPHDGGPIFVYFATYERGRLQELARRHPEHGVLLSVYIERLVDLLPLVKHSFYDPSMKGSFSIKKVLPVVAPDLDYGELTEIQEGVGAQLAYIRVALDPSLSAEQKAETEKNARIYCRQDTWAMVEVAYFLAGAERPVRPAGM